MHFHPLYGQPLRRLPNAFCRCYQLPPKCLHYVVCRKFLDCRLARVAYGVANTWLSQHDVTPGTWSHQKGEQNALKKRQESNSFQPMLPWVLRASLMPKCARWPLSRRTFQGYLIPEDLLTSDLRAFIQFAYLESG